jgi:hypothetical protein
MPQNPLAFRANQSDSCPDAVPTAEGERTKMITENSENTNTSATVGAQGAAVAPEKAPAKKTASPKKGAPKGQKSAKAAKPKPTAASKTKKATPAKTTAKAPKAAKPDAEGVRAGSKTATILALLQRAKGATLAEIMAASSWQAHSCRGFISGTLGKKMGLTVKSEKREDGTRVYSIAK